MGEWRQWTSDTLVGAIIGAVFALLGVGLGWLLNYFAEDRRYKEREDQRRTSTRTVLWLEFEQNRKTLEEFWSRVRTLPVPAGVNVGYQQPDEDGFVYRRQLSQLVLPSWGRLMWTSQAGLLADVLDRQSLERAYTLNMRLDAFTEAREAILERLDRASAHIPDWHKLEDAYSEWRKGMEKAASSGDPIPTLESDEGLFKAIRAFNQETLVYWATCEAVASELKTRGNPIVVEVPKVK